MSDVLIHSEVGRLGMRQTAERIISAGFAEFSEGTVRCYGESISLRIKSRPDDTQALADQLSIEVLSTDRLYEKEEKNLKEEDSHG
jgi:hypothetical protein